MAPSSTDSYVLGNVAMRADWRDAQQNLLLLACLKSYNSMAKLEVGPRVRMIQCEEDCVCKGSNEIYSAHTVYMYLVNAESCFVQNRRLNEIVSQIDLAELPLLFMSSLSPALIFIGSDKQNQFL